MLETEAGAAKPGIFPIRMEVNLKGKGGVLPRMRDRVWDSKASQKEAFFGVPHILASHTFFLGGCVQVAKCQILLLNTQQIAICTTDPWCFVENMNNSQYCKRQRGCTTVAKAPLESSRSPGPAWSIVARDESLGPFRGPYFQPRDATSFRLINRARNSYPFPRVDQ